MAEAPDFQELTPERRERLYRFRDEHEGEELGPIADRVLFEDDKVRIWEMRLPPGGHSALHKHENDYYLVMLTGDAIAGVPPRSSNQEPYVAKLPPGGNTVFLPKGDTEWAVNVGDTEFYEILVELKG